MQPLLKTTMGADFGKFFDTFEEGLEPFPDRPLPQDTRTDAEIAREEAAREQIAKHART